MVADRGYDYDHHRILLRQRRIRPLISRRGTRDDNQPVRWVIERTLALLHQIRRLAARWERRTDIHRGFSPRPPASSGGADSHTRCVRRALSRFRFDDVFSFVRDPATLATFERGSR